MAGTSSSFAGKRPAHGARMRRVTLTPATLGAIGIITLALALRILIAALGWPPDDSDEGTMGIMALHIAHAGAHPIYFYGQAYMGVLEAYIGAFFFHFFGASVLTLRSGAILLYALFLAGMYLLARLLYNTTIALITLLLLSLGTQEMLFRQIEAAGGYVETLLFGVTALLLAAWLALRLPFAPELADIRDVWRRRLVFFGWGLAAGLGLWSDVLVLPFVITSAALLVASRGRELRTRTGLLPLAGLLFGAAPVLLHDLTSPLDQSMLAVMWQLQHQGGGTSLSLLVGGIAGTLTVSLPNVLGATALCPIKIHDAWPISQHALGCTAIRTGWGLGYLVLLSIAALLALRPLWRIGRRFRAEALDEEQRRSAALEAARLAVIVSGALVLAAYAISPIAARAPWPSTRYLLGLFITFPAALWPVWRLGADTGSATHREPPPFASRRYAVRWVICVLIVLVLIRGTIFAVGGALATHSAPDLQRALIAGLERASITHIYTDYWNCDSVAFQSDERITCAVLDDSLAPGYNRYAPYVVAVWADPCAAYVFPSGSPQATAFAGRPPPSGRIYHQTTLAGYVVYSPCRPVV